MRAVRFVVLACMIALAGPLMAQPPKLRPGIVMPGLQLDYLGQVLQRLWARQAEAAARRDSLVRLARAQVGRRYVYGGDRPDLGFDCSGFVRYVAQLVGLRLPRTAALQALLGRPVPLDALRPGDLLFFGTAGGRVTHVGLYVGDGRYVHASSQAGRVVEAWFQPDRSGAYRWLGARRLPALDEP